ncbi:MAG TPA: GNAT family N-acetyltransferase [Polyangiaceae bacterium]|nr:GNAT family N-acetyltransferase [Polyangiaceae bacterium]
MTSDLAITQAEPRHAEALAALFESNGFGCFCRFWHFAGTSREWLERCFTHPEDNRAEMQAALAQSSPEMWGLVAEDAAGDVVGWLKAAPAGVISKLYNQRLYKGLPCFGGDRSGVFSIGCMLVREDMRRRGIARSLLRELILRAPSWGARTLEAFPRGDAALSDAALQGGPLALLSEAGFRVVHDFFPYPVLRLDLGAPGAVSELRRDH